MTAVQNPQDPTATAPVAESHLVTAVKRLDSARRLTATTGDLLKSLRDQWELEHAAALEAARAAGEAEDIAEAELRALAQAHYATTGEKKPAPGVEIKLTTEVEITDLAAALAYAKRADLFLQLDEKGYKTLAKTNDVPGAVRSEVPKASIARDLGAALFAGGVQ